MRRNNAELDLYRETHPAYGKSPDGEMYGYFEFRCVDSLLGIISSGYDTGNGWEHVSVSLVDRVPTWQEMCAVKDLFWRRNETVLQFHPEQSKYVNIQTNTLHLWKPSNAEIELPPGELV